MVELTFPDKVKEVTSNPWILFIDGSSTSSRAGAGIVLISPDQQSFTTAIRLRFHATNNEAEYEALINGLEMAMAMGVKKLKIFSDSQLVAYQMSGEYEVRSEQMAKYQLIAKTLIEKFDKVFIELVPRLENTQADALARLAMSEGVADMSNISIIDLASPSGSTHTMNLGEVIWLEQILPTSMNFEVYQIATSPENWMTPSSSTSNGGRT